MNGITSHVLDVALGRPAAGVRVQLEVAEGSAWRRLAEAVTDSNGRVADLLGGSTPTESRTYRLTFDTGAYFAATNRSCFYPRVEIIFQVSAPGEHHHVPLLMAPYGYSTYRGS